MNQRRWSNGSWSRLTRREIFVRNAADGRWQVELRRGGPGGRTRSRSFATELDAVAWVEASVVEPGAGWREIGPSPVKARARRAGSRARAADGTRAGGRAGARINPACVEPARAVGESPSSFPAPGAA